MTRSDFEQLRVRRPLVDAHRADQADPADIQRAYLRFSWARRKAPAKLPFLRWLVAGVAIGAGVASAASLAPRLVIRSPAPSGSAKVSPRQAQHQPIGLAARRSSSHEEPSLVEAVPASSAAQSSTALPVRSAIGTPVASTRRSPAPLSTASTLRPSTSEDDWERAAVALRTGDLSAAEAALANLEKSDSLPERQAAELARAQLLVKSGRTAEAINTLQRLASEGSSAVIRSQATSTLRTLGH